MMGSLQQLWRRWRHPRSAPDPEPEHAPPPAHYRRAFTAAIDAGDGLEHSLPLDALAAAAGGGTVLACVAPGGVLSALCTTACQTFAAEGFTVVKPVWPPRAADSRALYAAVLHTLGANAAAADAGGCRRALAARRDPCLLAVDALHRAVVRLPGASVLLQTLLDLFGAVRGTPHAWLVGCTPSAWARLSGWIGIERAVSQLVHWSGPDADALAAWLWRGHCASGFDFDLQDNAEVTANRPPESVRKWVRDALEQADVDPATLRALWLEHARWRIERDLITLRSPAAPTLAEHRQLSPEERLMLVELELHERLDADILAEQFQMTPAAIAAALARLLAGGLIATSADGGWRLAPGVAGTVRRRLRSAHLID